MNKTSLIMLISLLLVGTIPTIISTRVYAQTVTSISSPPDGQGVYESCAPIQNETACLNNLQTIATGGFKLVVNYSVLYATPQQITNYANKANSLGIKVIWAMNDSAFWNGTDLRGYFSNLGSACNCSDNAGFIAYFINLVKNNLGTWGYYIGDEASPNNHDPIKTFTDIVHQTDPDHPRLFIGSSPFASGMSSTLPPFADTTDVIGADYYPVGRTDIPNGVNAMADIASAVQNIATQNGKNSAMVLQAFNWGWGGSANSPMSYLCSPFPSCVPSPTVDQMTLMRDLALQNASPRIILWYSFFDIMNNSGNPTQYWNNLVQAAFASLATTSSGPTNGSGTVPTPTPTPTAPVPNPNPKPNPAPVPPTGTGGLNAILTELQQIEQEIAILLQEIQIKSGHGSKTTSGGIGATNTAPHPAPTPKPPPASPCKGEFNCPVIQRQID